MTSRGWEGNSPSPRVGMLSLALGFLCVGILPAKFASFNNTPPACDKAEPHLATGAVLNASSQSLYFLVKPQTDSALKTCRT
jgi:hypothetical protein